MPLQLFSFIIAVGLLNFAVSAAFVFAGHLVFTMAFDASYVPAMIIGKLTAGVLALLLANYIHKRVVK